MRERAGPNRRAFGRELELGEGRQPVTVRVVLPPVGEGALRIAKGAASMRERRRTAACGIGLRHEGETWHARMICSMRERVAAVWGKLQHAGGAGSESQHAACWKQLRYEQVTIKKNWE